MPKIFLLKNYYSIFFCVVVFLFVGSPHVVIGQGNLDSCIYLKGSKAYISVVDSNFIALSILKKGFHLVLNDTTLNVHSFHFAFTSNAQNGAYYAAHYKGNQFNPATYPSINEHLNSAQRIFIDNIKAHRGDSCFYIRSFSIAVK